MPLLHDIARGLTHLVFPQLCEGCRLPLIATEDTLCLSCLLELPRTGYHAIPENEAALRFAGRVPYQNATSLAHFTAEGLLQHLLHRLKYQNKKGVGLFLGRQLGYDLLQSTWVADIDLIIPVPLHPKKEASRSYNQSNLIALGMGEVTRKDTSDRLLRRVRHTQSQTQKNREERIANVKDAFLVMDGRALMGKHVLLVDDVLTTGATLEAAATALLRVPELKISLATIGIAEN